MKDDYAACGWWIYDPKTNYAVENPRDYFNALKEAYPDKIVSEDPADGSLSLLHEDVPLNAVVSEPVYLMVGFPESGRDIDRKEFDELALIASVNGRFDLSEF